MKRRTASILGGVVLGIGAMGVLLYSSRGVERGVSAQDRTESPIANDISAIARAGTVASDPPHVTQTPPLPSTREPADRGFALIGRLVDSQGNPLSGMEVTVSGWFLRRENSLPPWERATTNTDGSFRLDDVAVAPLAEWSMESGRWPAADQLGSANLEVRGFAAREVSLGMTAGSRTCVDLGTVRMPRASRVRGRVTTVDGEPAGGLLVIARSEGGGGGSAFADLDGNFAIDGLGPGSNDLRALGRGLARSVGLQMLTDERIGVSRVELDEGQEKEVQIHLPATRSVRGILIESELAPFNVASAYVVLRSLDGSVLAQTTTDLGGAFEFPEVSTSGEVEVFVVRDEQLLAHRRVAIRPGRWLAITPDATRVKPMVHLRVTHGATGEAIRKANFALARRTSPLETAPRGELESSADEPGVFAIPYLPEGLETFSIVVDAGDLGTAISGRIERSGSQDLGPIDIVLSEAIEIRGRLVNADTGESVDGAHIELRRAGSEAKEPLTFSTSGTYGKFRFRLLDDGPFDLRVNDAECRPAEHREIFASRSASEVVIRVEVISELYIRIPDAKDAELQDVSLRILRNGAPIEGELMHTWGRMYKFRTWNPGPCVVVVNATQLGKAREGSATAQILAGDRTAVSVTFRE